MLKTEDEEKASLRENKRGDELLDIAGLTHEKKRKKKKKKRKKGIKKEEQIQESEEVITRKKTMAIENLFNIIGRYNLIKMLGFGSFGEIHLAFDNQLRSLCAIKFELLNQKNPQLKHEYNILEQLNKLDNTNQSSAVIQDGIPKVYNFENIEGKCNLMVMEFLGPSLADLFMYKNKKFNLTTICLIGLQMIQRIELMHEKGFIHRDIKPENFVIGLNEKSHTVYIIDFGLSRRYKDKNTGQHIPYRENRHLVGTARYASINAHLGIEQSRRDDIESIGYALVYFYLGRLPWQSKNDKINSTQKIMEKKLMTPPEVLCKKLPEQFAYYFHYCRNLKYEDRPDYGTLKALFWDLLTNNGQSITTEHVFDWYNEENVQENNNQEETKKRNDGEANLIDITPSKRNSEKLNSKKDQQFTFIKSNDFNSPNKNAKLNKVPSEKSKKKSVEASFSESGSGSENSSDNSEKEDKRPKKAHDFNLLGKSSSEKSDKQNNNFNVDDEIAFKYDTSKSSNFDADVILNVKK